MRVCSTCTRVTIRVSVLSSPRSTSRSLVNFVLPFPCLPSDSPMAWVMPRIPGPRSVSANTDAALLPRLSGGPSAAAKSIAKPEPRPWRPDSKRRSLTPSGRTSARQGGTIGHSICRRRACPQQASYRGSRRWKRRHSWPVTPRRSCPSARPHASSGTRFVALRTGIRVASSATGSGDRAMKSSHGAARSPSRPERSATTCTAARPASLCSWHNCTRWPAATNSYAPHQERSRVRSASSLAGNGRCTFRRSRSIAGTWASLMPHAESPS